jgi:hypothetical protein
LPEGLLGKVEDIEKENQIREGQQEPKALGQDAEDKLEPVENEENLENSSKQEGPEEEEEETNIDVTEHSD